MDMFYVSQLVQKRKLSKSQTSKLREHWPVLKYYECQAVGRNDRLALSMLESRSCVA
jgi:hypothetical protein